MVLPVGRGTLLRVSCHLRRDLLREGARQLDEASLDEGQSGLSIEETLGIEETAAPPREADGCIR